MSDKSKSTEYPSGGERSPSRKIESLSPSKALSGIGVFKSEDKVPQKVAMASKGLDLVVENISDNATKFSLVLKLTNAAIKNRPTAVEAALDRLNHLREEEQNLKPLEITIKQVDEHTKVIVSEDSEELRFFLDALFKKGYASREVISEGFSILETQKVADSVKL